MSQQQHTPEPWQASENLVFSIAKDCIKVLDEVENEATARRIVACVNACEDILDYELSLGCVARLSEQLRTVTKQRDELLSALHNIRALNPMLEILDERRRLFVISNNFELKYLPIYADQPDPTYIVKWVWEVRNQHGSSVAEAHEWLYQAIDNAELAAIASVKGGA